MYNERLELLLRLGLNLNARCQRKRGKEERERRGGEANERINKENNNPPWNNPAITSYASNTRSPHSLTGHILSSVRGPQVFISIEVL